MAELSKEEKQAELKRYCEGTICVNCKIKKQCDQDPRCFIDMDDDEINNLYGVVFKPAPHRITIRDLIDLLDYDRTGIRSVRIVDEETKNTDTLQTDSHLLQFIEDTPVNCIDTVGGVLTMYCDFGEAGHGTD